MNETKYFIPRIVEVTKEEYEAYQVQNNQHASNAKGVAMSWLESIANSALSSL